MKAWFENLEERERIMVIAAAVVVVVFLLYLIVLEPLHDGHSRMKERVAYQRETAEWMLQSAHEVTKLKRTGGQAGEGLGGRSLLAVADSTARAGGLGPALKRVEPEGRGGVKVWLEGASFDELVKWLGTLSISHGVDVDSASLEKSESAGRVNARLTLQAAVL